MLGLQPGGRLPAAAPLAAAAERPARVRAAGDDRRAAVDPLELAQELAAAPIEVVICATDVSGTTTARPAGRSSSPTRRTDAAGDALAGSARVGGDQRARAAAPGRRPDRDRRRLGAELPARRRARPAGREPRRRLPLRPSLPAGRHRARSRACAAGCNRFRAVPPVRAFIAELDEAEARQLRGEPVHLGDMIVRLMRVAIQRNTALEERLGGRARRGDPGARRAARRRRADRRRAARPGRRRRAARAVEARFAAHRAAAARRADHRARLGRRGEPRPGLPQPARVVERGEASPDRARLCGRGRGAGARTASTALEQRLVGGASFAARQAGGRA